MGNSLPPPRRALARLVRGLLPLLAAGAASAAPPSLVLLTLDTTRADHVGAYGAAGARTPVLDRLAARGTRYARALAPSPLTLPAHASLLTGLAVPEHGVRDNGTAVLPDDLPTLATALAERGYATGAFVASRVLDRRFGLGRGFDVYDDRMTAEHRGQYGYPERGAAAVTAAAIAWASALPAGKPWFLWVHYYDPHAPYRPPPRWRGDSEKNDYAGEIAYVDAEIGRLLAALPPGEGLVAVAGDHGEMLGEHGERGHGVFLYRAALEVPLILAGPGVPAGRVVREAVATRRLAPTLLALLGVETPSATALPGLGGDGDGDPQLIYSQTQMPQSAYGWAPLAAVSDQRYRFIAAPRPELYDYVADPGETRNLIAERRRDARRLSSALAALEAGFERGATARGATARGATARGATARRQAVAPPPDPRLEADLRSLGYLSTPGSDGGGTIDPKDGIELLADFERAVALLATSAQGEALPILERLVARNPRNVPFLTRLAAARLENGEPEAAVATFHQAVALDPRLPFLHRQLADAYLRLGRLDEARAAYERTLVLDSRSAAAWIGLAELAHRAGDAQEERRLLLAAVDAGTASATILSRLARLESVAGDRQAAELHLREARRLLAGQ